MSRGTLHGRRVGRGRWGRGIRLKTETKSETKWSWAVRCGMDSNRYNGEAGFYPNEGTRGSYRYRTWWRNLLGSGLLESGLSYERRLVTTCCRTGKGGCCYPQHAALEQPLTLDRSRRAEDRPALPSRDLGDTPHLIDNRTKTRHLVFLQWENETKWVTK